LFDLSRDVLQMTDSREALSVLAASIACRCDLEFVAIALPRLDEWEVFEAGARPLPLDPSPLSNAFAAAQTVLEFDAYARTAKTRASGTGMGLWIVRGLLAAERGRVWAENDRDGGAQFTIAVPAEVRTMEPAASPTS
jgi:hypothetical protein